MNTDKPPAKSVVAYPDQLCRLFGNAGVHIGGIGIRLEPVSFLLIAELTFRAENEHEDAGPG